MDLRKIFGYGKLETDVGDFTTTRKAEITFRGKDGREAKGKLPDYMLNKYTDLRRIGQLFILERAFQGENIYLATSEHLGAHSPWATALFQFINIKGDKIEMPAYFVKYVSQFPSLEMVIDFNGIRFVFDGDEHIQHIDRYGSLEGYSRGKVIHNPNNPEETQFVELSPGESKEFEAMMERKK